MRSALIHSVKPEEWLNKSLVLSSQQMDWNGILVQQFQSFPTSTEVEIPALSNHWLNLPLGQPVRLTQKCDDRLHDSIVQKGDCIFCPSRTTELLALWGKCYLQVNAAHSLEAGVSHASC